jgi:hypothetical protein
MTRRKAYELLLGLLLAGHLWAQARPKAVYVESFRKGPVRISEYTAAVVLDARTPSYDARIRDAAGNERYQLSLLPQRVGEGDNRILSWRVQLTDLRRRYLGNLLVATKPPSLLSDRPEDRSWWLDPNPYAVVPLLARRVFKVEGFYCVVQVKEQKLLVPGRFLPDWIKVEVQFTEQNPLAN